VASVATAVGILLAYKSAAPDFAPGEWLTSTLASYPYQCHVFGWPAWLWSTGLLRGRAQLRVAAVSARLAWIGLVLFNVAALAGTIALDLGYSAGSLEYREWPWPIRLIFLAALAVTAWNLMAPLRAANTDEFISRLYIVGGVLWASIFSLVAILAWYSTVWARCPFRLLHAQRSRHVVHAAHAGMLYYALPRC